MDAFQRKWNRVDRMPRELAAYWLCVCFQHIRQIRQRSLYQHIYTRCGCSFCWSVHIIFGKWLTISVSDWSADGQQKSNLTLIYSGTNWNTLEQCRIEIVSTQSSSVCRWCFLWDSATSDVDARYTLPFINHLARDKMKNDNRQRQTIAFEEYSGCSRVTATNTEKSESILWSNKYIWGCARCG